MTVPDLGAAVTTVLGRDLAAAGLSVDGRAASSVTYRDRDRLIRFEYFVEELPEAALMVSVGRRHDDGQLMVVGLWRMYSDYPVVGPLPTLRFGSSSDLVRQLEVVRTQWLPRLVWPALSDRERIELFWSVQRSEQEREYRVAIVRRHLLAARRAYEVGDLATVVEAYASVAADQLSAADRRRLVMAQRAVRREDHQ